MTEHELLELAGAKRATVQRLDVEPGHRVLLETYPTGVKHWGWDWVSEGVTTLAYYVKAKEKRKGKLFSNLEDAGSHLKAMPEGAVPAPEKDESIDDEEFLTELNRLEEETNG